MTKIVSTLRNWDDRLVLDVAHRRNEAMNSLMSFATKLGDGWAWLFLSLLIAVFDPLNLKHSLLPMSIGLLIEFPLQLVLKNSFSRPRPFEICDGVGCLVRPGDRYSFPSGHMSCAVVVMTVIGSVYSWLFIPLFLLALMIGISRVYLGVHYPTDVLAGAVLGFLSGSLALWLI